MFTRERRDHIARVVEEHGRAGVAELSERFSVSPVTIRKDLVALQAEGRVRRAHGGVLAVDRGRPERSFASREQAQSGEKAAIGAAAAELIHDGESIALDASTTALHVARAIKERGGWAQLTVVTNGLRIAAELAGYPGISVAMPGGWVRWEALSVVGGLGEGVFERINVQTAFVSAAGFTLESGLSDATDAEAQLKRSMVAVARSVVAVVDHTKWGHAAFATFCPTDQISLVISDQAAPPDLVERMNAHGTDVRLVRALGNREERGAEIGQSSPGLAFLGIDAKPAR